MSFLKKLFGKKEEPIKTYEDFWNWFVANERAFFTSVKSMQNIEQDFFDKLSPKLNQLNDGYFFVTGMKNPDTVELILTAEGIVKNIVFVEELVSAAPQIDGWLFTALKPSLDITDVAIAMGGYTFNSEKIFFYAEELKDYPDEIDIKVIHTDHNETDKAIITNGTYIFLDNLLGELNFATTVDNLKVIAKKDAGKELIPIEKLKPYLIWREKEFIEKYESVHRSTDEDSYSALEAELPNGNPLVAIINMGLLQWDGKASHPWVMNVEMKYKRQSNNGMPDNSTYQLLNQIEEEIMSELKDVDGYLNIGRQTADSTRDIFFACKDFRKPAKVMQAIQQKYSDRLPIDLEIYKDKYWRSFNKFTT